MDGLTFVSNLIHDLAWPAVAVLAIFTAMSRAPQLMRFIKAVRYKDLEVTIRADFDVARAEADKIQIASGNILQVNDGEKQKIIQLANIDPAVAVIEIWRKLEAETTKFIQHNGLMRFTTPEKFMLELSRQGKISESEVQLYQKLRKIRNESVHSRSNSALTLAEVLEFQEFAEVLVNRFDAMKRKPDYISVPAS